MASTADIRNGVVLNMDGQLWTVIEFQHVKPGKGGAFVRTKVKNVVTGKTVDRTFNAGAKIETEVVDRREFQFLYKDGEAFVFMDVADYDQITIPGAIVEYTILVSNPGSNPIDADSVIVSDPLPTQVALLAGDLGAPGSGPVAFIAGGSGLTFAPADAEYSTDGTNWIGYVPVAGGDATDPLVKAIRVNPEGVFNGGGAQFTLKFRARVK